MNESPNHKQKINYGSFDELMITKSNDNDKRIKKKLENLKKFVQSLNLCHHLNQIVRSDVS